MSLQFTNTQCNSNHATLGKHVIAELSGCDSGILNDITTMDGIFTQAIEIAGATLLQKVAHKFTPQGLSLVFVLSESHLSIHTWPESGYASIDMYTCGNSNPVLAIEYIQRELKATSFYSMFLSRGIPKSDSTYYHEILERS